MAGTILNSRIARFAIVTVAAMAALVILWFTVLPPIIEQQIIRALVAQGFAEADIRLSQLSLNHATLENLTLGTESGFSVSEIKISYTIASLLRSEVSSIILIGFRSDIAYQDRVWDLGPFDAFIGAGDSMGVQTQAVVLPFDRVELRDARIHFDWQDREFLLPFSAELNRAGEHDIDLGLRASLEGASITINGGANLDSLRGRAEIDISQLPARLICQLGESSLQEHQVSSSGELNIAGDVRFVLKGEPSWQAQIQVAEQALELSARLLDPPLELFLRELSANLQINHPGLATVKLQTRINDALVNIEGGFDSRLGFGSGRINIPKLPESMLKAIAEAWLAEPAISIRGPAALDAQAECRGDQLTVGLALDGRQLELSTSIGSSVGRLTRPLIEADLHAQIDSTAVSSMGGEVYLRQLSAAITDTIMSIRVGDAAVQVSVPSDTSAPLKGVVQLSDVTLEENQTRLRIGPVVVSGSFSALDDEGEFELSSRILPEALLSVSGTFSGLSADGQLKGKTSGQINARIPPFPLEHAKPVYRRIPNMADVDLGGIVAADGLFELRGGTLIPRITVDLKDIWWEKPEAKSRIEGISGTVLVNQLAPLSTDGDQELSWTRFTAGTFEVTDGRVRFQITGADTSITGRVECNWADGRLWSDDIQIRPTTTLVRGEIHLEKLSLQSLLDFLEYEGVKGEGWIYGHIPIQVRYGDRPRASFGDGILKADPPKGRLQLSKDTAMTILGLTYEIDPATADNQEMARLLMLRALQDIEYSNLRVTCQDDSTLGWVTHIQIQGHGPYGDRENLVPIAGLNIEVNNLDDLLNSIIFGGLKSRNLGFGGQR